MSQCRKKNCLTTPLYTTAWLNICPHPTTQHHAIPWLQWFCSFSGFSPLLVFCSEHVRPSRLTLQRTASDPNTGCLTASRFLQFTDQTASRGNGPDLYSGDAPFETRPTHRIHWRRIQTELVNGQSINQSINQSASMAIPPDTSPGYSSRNGMSIHTPPSKTVVWSVCICTAMPSIQLDEALWNILGKILCLYSLPAVRCRSTCWAHRMHTVGKSCRTSRLRRHCGVVWGGDRAVTR
jgi:hypothetical protein